MSSVINVRLNEKMTLQFVELYRDERILWDKKHESYNKRAERLRAYRRIADGMAVEGMGVPEVASKIKNIRSTYLQELKKIKKLAQRHVQQEDENAVSVQYVPKMLWFPILDAMIGDETVKRIYSLPSAADTLSVNYAYDENPAEYSYVVTDDNTYYYYYEDDDGDDNNDDDDDDDNDDDDDDDDDNDDDDNDDDDDDDDDNPSSSAAAAASVERVIKRSPSSLSREPSPVAKRFVHQQQLQQHSATELFANYVVTSLDAMSPRLAVWAQKELYDVLVKYKLMELDQDGTSSSSDTRNEMILYATSPTDDEEDVKYR